MNKFDKLGIGMELLSAIDRLGFTEPTQIQEGSIPYIMQGKDVMGESATGSGKTLAFGCGIVEDVVPGEGIQALVLTPTRELAEQVNSALKELAALKPMKIIPVYGGVSITPQMRDLRSADVVVATPGRMLDHLSRGTIDLSKVRILVLDEADRMLDMGFIDDVERIIRKCPRERQTLFFSATLKSSIRGLADKFMRDPIRVNAKRYVDPKKLKQVYYNVQKNMKISLLVHLLQQDKDGLAMVFCNTRRTTDFVMKNLKANKIKAIAIHGGFTQNKRSKTLETFNSGWAGVLVCTDVASRGLHIDNVSHIYNYEIPKDPKDYVHRIGRTARAGEYGQVVNLLCEFDHDNFYRVQGEYRDFNVQKMDQPYVKKVGVVGLGSFGGGHRPNNRFGSRSHGRRPPFRKFRRR